jgi:hypothetical protein
MTEQQLRDFGTRAEGLVIPPGFADLDRRGNRLRNRRRAGIGAALAVVLTVAGVAVSQSRVHRADQEPIKPPPTPAAEAEPYPGAEMETLPPGRYRIEPTPLQNGPVAELTLPRGWNSWAGPNRFDGHAPGRSNDEALGHMTWYVGVLVVDVNAVASTRCAPPGIGDLLDGTKESLLHALTRLPGHTIVQGPEPVTRFGRPATHVRLRTPSVRCKQDVTIFDTTTNGSLQELGWPGAYLDLWVVDVGGVPILVQAARTPGVPPAVRDQLREVVDSISFHFDR